MKRFRRILFNTLTAISLLLAIATAGLWVRSEWRNDRVCFITGMPSEVRAYGIINNHGQMLLLSIRIPGDSFVFANLWPSPRNGWEWQCKDVDPQLNEPQGGTSLPGTNAVWLWGLGYTISLDSSAMQDTRCVVGLPHWLLLLFFSFLPVKWQWITIHKRRKSFSGHCPACGYDMRANPARCSECGREAKPV